MINKESESANLSPNSSSKTVLTKKPSQSVSKNSDAPSIGTKSADSATVIHRRQSKSLVEANIKEVHTNEALAVGDDALTRIS